MMKKKDNRGGARPGAGRKLQGTGRKQTIGFSLSPEGVKARNELKASGYDVAGAVDRFVQSLADSK